MAIENPSYETVGSTQGSASAWTATFTGAATGAAAIEDGAGLLFGWEGFGGWVADQAEYRLVFADTDLTAGAVEDFGLWVAGQEEYRALFADSDLADGAVEGFGAWQAGQADYRDAFEVGDLTAGDVEVFDEWVTDQDEYRADFGGGDTTTGLFKTGASSTAAADSFDGCRTDVEVEVTPSSDTISAPGHAFSANDPVLWQAAGTLASPFAKNVTYFVRNPVPGVSLELSATSGGASLTPTNRGDGTQALTGDPRFFWRNPRTGW